MGKKQYAMDQYNYREQRSTGLQNQLERKTYQQCWVDTGQNPAHGPCRYNLKAVEK